jgi:hypothetical protein
LAEVQVLVFLATAALVEVAEVRGEPQAEGVTAAEGGTILVAVVLTKKAEEVEARLTQELINQIHLMLTLATA